MIKKVTSVTSFNDAVGKRMSITYSEIDEESGQIFSDGKRIDRIILDGESIDAIEEVETIAQSIVDNLQA